MASRSETLRRMPRRATRSLLVVGAALVALAAPLPARAETSAVNQIVVNASFGNGAPPSGASLLVRVFCGNIGGDPVGTVVDETEPMSAPFDPITFDIPVLATGATGAYVGCEVSATQSGGLFGLPYYSCGVLVPGTPSSDPAAPTGCGSQVERVDAFFPATVSGAVYDVTILTLLADQPAPAPAPEVVSAPVFTG